MKTKFKAYYPLSKEQKKEIFNAPNTYFVFDTNALLDIYRLGKTVSQKVITLFEKYANQIRIPYHVAEEYHNHIYDIMIECDSLYSTLSEKITAEYIMQLMDKDSKDQFKYEHLAKMLKKHINDALVIFRRKISIEKKFISNQLETWELPTQLAAFLGDKILEKLPDDKIKEIEKDGERRFELNLPPGFGDDDKKNGNKYGDLIIWNEILKFAEEHPDNSIIFVSRDINKGDWQWKLHGRKCGLHPHLLKEFYAVSHGQILMYPLQQFINYANETSKVFNQTEIESIQAIQLPDLSNRNELWNRDMVEKTVKIITPEDIARMNQTSLAQSDPAKNVPEKNTSPDELKSIR